MDWIKILFGWSFYVPLTLAIVAFVGLVIGKYSRASAIGTSIIIFFIPYLFLSVIVSIWHFSEWEEEKADQRVHANLDDAYEERVEGYDNLTNLQKLMPYTVSYTYKDDGGDMVYEYDLYAGNFNSSYDFYGQLKITYFSDQEKVIDIHVYDVEMDAGGKTFIKNFKLDDEMHTYSWSWRETEPINFEEETN
ncbi:hypothetical protein [Aureibacillus halotolerans]|uniref:Uncharacterized protein n=1 Tax=Aureibacillus halotolerans TaxID=1508390 RepID=A0A4R6UDY6_9BACI|nr:hypothetical protein [Aureibacillus halotolerans]TDQ43025.1 hypothetical protein EV213_101457 [Aureibacillus halotolerans]